MTKKIKKDSAGNDNDYFKEIESEGFTAVNGVLGLAFAAIVIALVFYIIKADFVFDAGPYAVSNLGAMGDFFGGVINPILSFLSIVLLVFSLKEAQKSLVVSRQNLLHAEKQIVNAIESQELVRFDTIFYSLFSQIKGLHKEIYGSNALDGQVDKSILDSVYVGYDFDTALRFRRPTVYQYVTLVVLLVERCGNAKIGELEKAFYIDVLVSSFSPASIKDIIFYVALDDNGKGSLVHTLALLQRDVFMHRFTIEIFDDFKYLRGEPLLDEVLLSHGCSNIDDAGLSALRSNFCCKMKLAKFYYERLNSSYDPIWKDAFTSYQSYIGKINERLGNCRHGD